MSDNGHERVRVLQVRARNVKKIREVSIDFEGDIHEIRGDTGQGKTTILESIEAGLRGLEPSMVRNGEHKAEIELTLSEAVIKRITPREGKETVMVTDSEGHPVEKAKEFLTALCGPTAFRPLDWVQLGGGPAKGKTERLRAQRDQLLEAIPLSLTYDHVLAAVDSLGEDHAAALKDVNLDGVDFAQHPFLVCSSLENTVYEYRKLQNERVKQAENYLELAPAPESAPPNTPAEELARQAKALEQRYWTAKGKQDNRASLRQRREDLAERIRKEEDELPDAGKLEETWAHYQKEATEATAEIERLEELLKAQKARLSEAQQKATHCEELQRRLENQASRKEDLVQLDAELADETAGEDLDALQRELNTLREKLEARRVQDKHEEAARRFQEAQAKSKLFGQLVELFRDDLPKALLETAALPVPGLGIEGETVTIDGVPLHQLGTSEQIRIGVLIAAALNPRSGFVLVDRAESLGKNDRKALAQAAHEQGLQLLMTYVDESAKPGPGVTVMHEGAAAGQG